MESASKGKGVKKVPLYAKVSLIKPPLKLSVEAVEGLIEGTCKHKRLLSKQLTEN